MNKETYLDKFYKYVALEDHDAVAAMRIPISDVFYIRAALEERMGMKLDVDHVRDALIAEGYTEYAR